MKFVVFKTSDDEFKEAKIIEFQTIGQLIEYLKTLENFQHEAIIGQNFFRYQSGLLNDIQKKLDQTDNWYIEIYDDWRE